MTQLIVAATLAAGLIGAPIQQLSPEAIAAAIEQGKAGKTLFKQCSGKGANGFDIVAEGPIGRIMRAAKEAKKKKKDFTAADVTAEMAGPWLTVTAKRVDALREQHTEYVTPNMPRGFKYRTELVIKSRPPGGDEAIVLMPLGPITYDASNSTSSRVVVSGTIPAEVLSQIALPGSDMAASFDLAAFKAIPHKDVEIYVFMTDTGGHACRISEKDRQAIQ